MPDAHPDYIPLPSDPRELTRELVMQCCPHPEVLIEAFARLAQQPQHTTQPARVLVKVAANDA